MSESALEFVDTWLVDKIDEMDDAPADIDAEAEKLAGECIAAAEEEGISKSDINEAFDDLAAFIASEIEDAFDRENRPDEGASLVDGDDPRVIEEEEDEEDEEEDDDDNKKDA